MRRIELTNAFRGDFTREKRGQHRRDPEDMASSVVSLLALDKPLAEKHRDHALGGQWRDHRECHLKPDLLADLSQTGFFRLTTGSLGLAQRPFSITARVDSATGTPPS